MIRHSPAILSYLTLSFFQHRQRSPHFPRRIQVPSSTPFANVSRDCFLKLIRTHCLISLQMTDPLSDGHDHYDADPFFAPPEDLVPPLSKAAHKAFRELFPPPMGAFSCLCWGPVYFFLDSGAGQPRPIALINLHFLFVISLHLSEIRDPIIFQVDSLSYSSSLAVFAPEHLVFPTSFLVHVPGLSG